MTTKLIENSEFIDTGNILENTVLISKQTFTNDKFLGEEILDCILAELNFVNCHFENIDFSMSEFFGCVFTNCKFTNVSFYKCEFWDLIMENCQFKKTELKRASLTATNEIKLTNCNFVNSDLSSATFSDGKLINCSFVNSNLSAVNFRNLELFEPKFDQCNLKPLLGRRVKIWYCREIDRSRDLRDSLELTNNSDLTTAKNNTSSNDLKK